MHNLITLSIQEKKILHLVSLGLKSKEIGERLFISPHTVKNHKSNICFKLNFKSTSELYKFAFINAALLQNGGGRVFNNGIGIVLIFS